MRIIIALGVAGLIVTQGTDLSAGRQVGLAAVIAATLLQSIDNANKVFPEMATMPIILVVLIVCVIGAIIGLINGIIIAYLNVTPFITTLGTMIIVYGINSLYYDFVGASPISGFDSGFSTFAQGFVALGSFRLSYITFYALIAVAFVWVLWNKTRFGKNIFAIGGNPEAAKVSGVNVALNLLMIYALSGVLTHSVVCLSGPYRLCNEQPRLHVRAGCHRSLRRRWRIVQRRCGYGSGRGHRCYHLHRNQLWPDVYRREPLLAVHHQGRDHHLRRRPDSLKYARKK